MSNKITAEGLAPSFPPPKTIVDFEKAIVLVEDWLKELEASRALIEAERTKTAKKRRHVKTRALKLTTKAIEETESQLAGLRDGLALVKSGAPLPPSPPLPSHSPDSPLTQLGDDDAQGEPDPSYRASPSGETRSSQNAPDPSLKTLAEGSNDSGAAVEEESDGANQQDEEERRKLATDAFHWNLYMQISALVDEDEETSSLNPDSLGKYMNDILLAIEGEGETNDEVEEDSDISERLEGHDNVGDLWGWGVYRETRLILDQYKERGVLTVGDRSALLRRLYDVICWDRDFVETPGPREEAAVEEEEQPVVEEEEQPAVEEEEQPAVEEEEQVAVEEEEQVAAKGNLGKEKVKKGKEKKRKKATRNEKDAENTKGKERAGDEDGDEGEGEEEEEEEEETLTREQIIAKRMSNAYNALCNAMTFEHDIPNGPRWDARRFAEMLPLYGTGSINIAMESFIVRKGLTRCHYHTLSDRTSKKNDDTRDGVTGVHFKPTKVVSAPARNLRLIPDRLPGTIPRLKGAVEMPKEGPSGVNGLTYHELREFFPVTEKGRRQLHCGCDLQEALTDFFFWKGFPYISSFSKDPEELFGMPVSPRIRTWFCTILDALSVNVRDLYAYDKQGNRRTEEDIVKARIRRLWDTIAEDVEDSMVLRPKRPRSDVEDGNGDPGPSKRRK
ncbi:hypothetical protein CC2G_004182 [Coprinopsis cinerea AmutBmut pab1-1]|nr:hypothetical protein CC2G_004182 [Coprinopsis cinerea AmutBmut pab1-1]